MCVCVGGGGGGITKSFQKNKGKRQESEYLSTYTETFQQDWKLNGYTHIYIYIKRIKTMTTRKVKDSTMTHENTYIKIRFFVKHKCKTLREIERESNLVFTPS